MNPIEQTPAAYLAALEKLGARIEALQAEAATVSDELDRLFARDDLVEDALLRMASELDTRLRLNPRRIAALEQRLAEVEAEASEFAEVQRVHLALLSQATFEEVRRRTTESLLPVANGERAVAEQMADMLPVVEEARGRLNPQLSGSTVLARLRGLVEVESAVTAEAKRLTATEPTAEPVSVA